MGEILEGDTFPCAYCKATGVLWWTNARCPVCRGKGEVKLNAPGVICVYCGGTGESQPRSRITCPVCRGKGVNTVREPIEECNACAGTGRSSDKLPCMRCKGKGVVTIKTPVA